MTLARFSALAEEHWAREKRIDSRFARLACIIANGLGSKPDGSSFELADFMPGEGPREQTVEEMVMLLEGMSHGSNR